MNQESRPELRERLLNPQVGDMAKIDIWAHPVRIKKIGGILWKFHEGGASAHLRRRGVEAMEGTPEFDRLTSAMKGEDEREPIDPSPNFLVEEIDEEGDPTGREIIVPLSA